MINSERFSCWVFSRNEKQLGTSDREREAVEYKVGRESLEKDGGFLQPRSATHAVFSCSEVFLPIICPDCISRDGLKKQKPQIHLCHLSNKHSGNMSNVWPELTLYMTIRHMAGDHGYQSVQGFSNSCFQWCRSWVTEWNEETWGQKLSDTHLEKGAITVQTITSEMHLPPPQGCI